VRPAQEQEVNTSSLCYEIRLNSAGKKKALKFLIDAGFVHNKGPVKAVMLWDVVSVQVTIYGDISIPLYTSQPQIKYCY
jgi:hypothetical protein